MLRILASRLSSSTTGNCRRVLSTARTLPASNSSDDEHQIRRDLAACYRLCAHFGMTDLVFTHITAKLPGGNAFLINPYGLLFDEITASSLVKVDDKCNKLEPSPHPVNPAGFNIHAAVHAARADAACVLHTHSRAGVAVAALQSGLLPISQHSTFVVPSLSYHDYEGVSLNEAERERLQANLGAKNMFLMLRNHGLLTLGSTIADAFVRMYFFDMACKIQLDAQAAGGAAGLRIIGDDVLNGMDVVVTKSTVGLGIGALCWPALLRLLDRKDDSYKL